MSRSARKSSLTNSANPQLERQARRINRQQKQLDRVMVSDMYQNSSTQLTGAKGRSIKLSDIKKITPLTDAQEDFFHAYDDGCSAIIMRGSPGVGKSFLATYKALCDVMQPEPQYDRIVLIRSAAPSRNQGFLPGSLEEKAEVYELPFKSIVTELTGRPEAYDKLKETGKIEFHTSSYLRSLTFNDSIIIVEESQNYTWQELSTAITRTGKNSRIIFCCDFAQNDLVQSRNDVSGLRQFIDVAQRMEEFAHINFTSADICRSGIVKSFIVNAEALGYI
jgi:phosphate starvation-inducible protein PhoH and related proteins